MSRSNIFMQLVTAAGPVVGEGLLEGWEGSVEIQEFEWDMHALKSTKLKAKGLAAQAAAAASAAASMLGLGSSATMQLDSLRFTKRFDVGSSLMHSCLDSHVKVLSASITVIYMKQEGRLIHQPGFVLAATDGYFESCALDVRESGMSKEVVEKWVLNFKNIKIMYMKSMGKDNLPTAPFFYSLPAEKP